MIVQPKSLKYRKAAAHAFMLGFICVIMFPLLMIVAISFRQGNFSVGDLIPSAATSTLDHWRLALGFNVEKHNRIGGANVEIIRQGSQVALHVTADSEPGFKPFLSESFEPEIVVAIEDGFTTIQGFETFSIDEKAEKLNEQATHMLLSDFATKLKVQVGSAENAATYVIDSIDRQGTAYTVFKETIVPPPFPVLRWLWNSIKVAFITAFFIICLSTTSAYAFARMRFAGRGVILNGMLVFQMFPAVLALVAIYALFDKIGEYVPWLGLNTHGGLILSYMGGIALHIWTIKGYFETIDPSLEQAAAIDGATPWQAFRLILLPLSVPILAVVFILAFIGTITEVPVASILLLDMNELTLAVGSQQYLYPQNYLWGDFAAAAVLSGLPITVVFLLAQKWLVGGLTAGGVKG